MEGVEIIELKRHEDHRGWLTEIFRSDETAFKPQMAYLSLTKPGMTRGPHEHREQVDYFYFIGKFRLYLWDNRETSSTYRERRTVEISERSSIVAMIPPGVVHAYKNTGTTDAFVVNLPNRLYRGWGKREEVDELRYEDDTACPFRVDV